MKSGMDSYILGRREYQSIIIIIIILIKTTTCEIPQALIAQKLTRRQLLGGLIVKTINFVTQFLQLYVLTSANSKLLLQFGHVIKNLPFFRSNPFI